MCTPLPPPAHSPFSASNSGCTSACTCLSNQLPIKVWILSKRYNIFTLYTQHILHIFMFFFFASSLRALQYLYVYDCFHFFFVYGLFRTHRLGFGARNHPSWTRFVALSFIATFDWECFCFVSSSDHFTVSYG